MFWGKGKMLKCGLALGAALAFTGSALAEAIVVRSAGPSAKSYPPGRKLADNAQLTLKANDQLVLLDGRGTRTVKGPGTFSVSGASARGGALATATRVLATQTGTERRGGAVRGTGSAPTAKSPNLWFVDVSKSSTVCVADPSSVMLWRPDASADATLTLTGGGANGSLEMARNVSVASWPKDSMPVTDGAVYTIAGTGGEPAKIRFELLGDTAEGLENTAAALIENGCDAQLDLLIETVALPDSGTAG